MTTTLSTEIRIKRLSPLGTIPAYHTEHAAGLDLHAAIAEPAVLGPGDKRPDNLSV